MIWIESPFTRRRLYVTSIAAVSVSPKRTTRGLSDVPTAIGISSPGNAGAVAFDLVAAAVADHEEREPGGQHGDEG